MKLVKIEWGTRIALICCSIPRQNPVMKHSKGLLLKHSKGLLLKHSKGLLLKHQKGSELAMIIIIALLMGSCEI